MTTIYLVRHAHADWQPTEARPLSARGRASAVRLADQLGQTPIAAIYSSPSRRALETVEPLAHRLQVQPKVLEDLRERELVTRNAAEFEVASEATWREPDVPCADAESNRAAQTRGVAVVWQTVGQHRDQQVILSTHGTLLALILHGFDGTFGYDFWRTLTFPDVYELTFHGETLARVVRRWQRSAPRL